MGNKKVFYLEFLVKMSKVRFSSKNNKEGFKGKMKKNNLEFSKGGGGSKKKFQL